MHGFCSLNEYSTQGKIEGQEGMHNTENSVFLKMTQNGTKTSNEPFFIGFCDEAMPIMNVELLKDVFEVSVNSVVTQVELVCSFHRGQSAGDRAKDILLPFRQLIWIFVILSEECFHDALRNHGIERRSTALHFFNCIDDVSGPG